MRRMLSLVVAACLLAAPAYAAGAKKATVVYGVVGPGYTITLKTAAGKTVKTLPHGIVTFHISDRSSNHDFHLTGPGVDRSTEVPQKGVYTWKVRLKAGKTYNYKCDPHEIIMNGHFRAT
jgi:plastocyanin